MQAAGRANWLVNSQSVHFVCAIARAALLQGCVFGGKDETGNGCTRRASAELSIFSRCMAIVMRQAGRDWLHLRDGEPSSSSSPVSKLPTEDHALCFPVTDIAGASPPGKGLLGTARINHTPQPRQESRYHSRFPQEVGWLSLLIVICGGSGLAWRIQTNCPLIPAPESATDDLWRRSCYRA